MSGRYGESGAHVAEVAQTLARLRALRQETVRREILEGGRIDLLATHVLGYEARPFHLEMLQFQVYFWAFWALFAIP